MPRAPESSLAAIKQAIDIVLLIGEYLPLQRFGSKFKALCPFHDDHNPSLEVNPERQSYKCWSCGAGGDIFDFVQAYERVEFPEALRMLAERAGVTLQAPGKGQEEGAGEPGITKGELLAAALWAKDQFREELQRSESARLYLAGRGIAESSVERFGLGYSPDQSDWLQRRARVEKIRLASLEAVGLLARRPDSGLTRDRFRGRVIFPIHDGRGRVIAFGGRVLPEIEKLWAEREKTIAKYVNSPETPLFQKRRVLYGSDLARQAIRQAGWVGVVEGYTDVIAAHQAGVENIVGTLGTALGDDHLVALKRLADKVVLVFDGDEAGQKAADRALELFLGHQIDVGVLSLPSGRDPCDFLTEEGVEAFRDLLGQAVDPLEFAIRRALSRHDANSPEGARLASEWVISILARVPVRHGAGLELKVAKALDKLSQRLRVPVVELGRALREMRAQQSRAGSRARNEPSSASGVSELVPAQLNQLDPIDRELVQIVLNEPEKVSALRGLIPAESLREPALRTILQACYDLEAEGESPSFANVLLRLESPGLRSLAAGLTLPIDPAPLLSGTQQAPTEARLSAVLERYAERDWRQRLRDLDAARAELDPSRNPDDYRALQREYLRVLNERPVPSKKTPVS